jgi:chaperonin cofactor prefoldin
MSEASPAKRAEEDWPANYFNYFTEVEEHFQKARGTGLFLLSPVDWALIENWKNAGIPLRAVLQGIDEAFEKWRSRKSRTRQVNSIAYCTQAVMQVAERTPEREARMTAAQQAPFAEEDLRRYLLAGTLQLRKRAEPLFLEVATSLEALATDVAPHLRQLEDLERRLSALEDKLVAAARTLQPEEELYRLRTALDLQLKPFRGKMTADQISALERRYLDSAILQSLDLPRLSLFYLH